MKLTYVASLFFRRGHDKALPAPPPEAVRSRKAPAAISKYDVGEDVGVEFGTALRPSSAETEEPVPVAKSSHVRHGSAVSAMVNEDDRDTGRKDKSKDLMLKKRPSFASLRKPSMLGQIHL